jgi:hypothetical protein
MKTIFSRNLEKRQNQLSWYDSCVSETTRFARFALALPRSSLPSCTMVHAKRSTGYPRGHTVPVRGWPRPSPSVILVHRPLVRKCAHRGARECAGYDGLRDTWRLGETVAKGSAQRRCTPVLQFLAGADIPLREYTSRKRSARGTRWAETRSTVSNSAYYH